MANNATDMSTFKTASCLSKRTAFTCSKQAAHEKSVDSTNVSTNKGADYATYDSTVCTTVLSA